MSVDRLQELFYRALDQDEQQLDAFLASECGQDEALLRDVRELLAADAAAQEESIWRARVDAKALGEPEIQDRSGQKIGPYRITRIIGEGGMGAVYQALREDSEYQQAVAIKFVKRGMDTDAIVRRFRNERQILANLEHPSIARLLDGGTTADGLPYLVMEFIDGKPLHEYCRQSGVSVDERLKLFGAICSAVHYAHQHLVIHRDLKPGNILVTAEGVPKLLDFGIARIFSAEPSQAANPETLVAERALTPGYASPEQINGQNITTASDVYSLGVILYEMLTGQSPYGTKKRTAAELMRAVCQEQPEKPSARQSPLKGDLDNIVLMALRKEPERRYASAEQFAEDVKRHLDLRPVIARGEGFGYVASRFIRRNWLATGAAVVITAMLVVGIVNTKRAESRAERRFNDVRQMAHSFVFDYYDAIEALPGATPVRQRMVKEALRYLDSLAGEADGIPLERELLQTYVKVSRVQGNTYESNLGDAAGAMASVRKAIAIGDDLAAKDKSAETLAALGGAYLDEAELLHAGNQLEAAGRAYNQALELTQSALKLHPDNSDLTIQLIRTERHLGDLNGADGMSNLGHSARAVELYRQAGLDGERLLSEHPKLLAAQQDLFNNYVAMAGIASTTGHSDQAVDGYHKALTMIRAISAANPDNANERMEIAGTSIRLAREFITASRPRDALPYFKEAEGIVTALCKADPQNELYQRNLSVTEVHIGNALMKDGEARGAIGYFTRASEMSARLIATHPGSAEFLGDKAVAERKLGQAFAAASDNGKAATHAEKSVEILEAVTAKSQDAYLLASLAKSEELVGDIRLQAKGAARAVPYFEKAQRRLANLAKADPANAGVGTELAVCEKKLAECKSKLRR